jgi:hypothetical protein
MLYSTQGFIVKKKMKQEAKFPESGPIDGSISLAQGELLVRNNCRLSWKCRKLWKTCENHTKEIITNYLERARWGSRGTGKKRLLYSET